jgi:hypothetical protein
MTHLSYATWFSGLGGLLMRRGEWKHRADEREHGPRLNLGHLPQAMVGPCS